MFRISYITDASVGLKEKALKNEKIFNFTKKLLGTGVNELRIWFPIIGGKIILVSI